MASKTSKYWDDRALRRLTGAEKTSEEYIKRVRKMYDKAYRDINKDIETIYKNYSKNTGIDVDTLKTLLTKKETDKVFKELKAKGYDKYVKDNYKSRITRLEQLKAQIYTKAKDVYSEEELINHQCYSEVYKNSYYRTIYDTQMGTGYNFGFGTIDDNLVKAVLNERWSGKNYKARVWGNTDILAESVSEIVGASILNGQSLSKTSKEIRERFGVSKYYAERLIRTETNHFYNEADAMAYEEMGIDKYVFVAVLDNRTSPMCQDHDNKVYDYKDKKEGFNFPPLHPNCRSTTRGYLGEEAEKHLQRRARDPKTGKSELIGNMSYKEWAKTKGIDVATTKRDGQLPTKSKVNVSKSVKTTPKKAKTVENIFNSVKLNGIDTEYQKDINNEFIKINAKYPIDLSTTQLKTNTATRQIGHSWNCIKAKWDRNTHSYKVSLRDELVLNKTKYKDKATAIATHDRANSYYKKPYSGDLTTLWHEYAHQIDDKYTMAINSKMADIKKGLTHAGITMSREDAVAKFGDFRDYNNLLMRDNMSKRVWQQLYDVMVEKNNGQYNRSSYSSDICEYLGRYALENNKEFLAEGFTAMNCIPVEEQSDFVKEFAKIFNAEFDKVLRR